MIKQKKTILILALIVVFFTVVIIAAIQLAKLEQKTHFKVIPVIFSDSASTSGVIVKYGKSVQRFSPLNESLVLGKNATMSLGMSYDADEDNAEALKVSPDGKYLAVLTPQRRDYYNYNDSQVSIITIINLNNGESRRLVEAERGTVIKSIAWDWSSDSVGFITVKRPDNMSGQGMFGDLFPSTGTGSFVQYLNTVNIKSGETTTRTYPCQAETYYDCNARLLTLNGDVLYIIDHNALITLSGSTTKKMTISEIYYSSYKIYYSSDYKAVVLSGEFEITYLDLVNQTMQSFMLSTGNSSSSDIVDIAISADHQSIALVKKTTSNVGSGRNSVTTKNETVWLYSFKDKAFQQIKTKSIPEGSSSISSSVLTTSVVFSPDSKQLAIFDLSNSSTTRPLIGYSYTVLNWEDKSVVKEGVVPNVSTAMRVLGWE